MLEFKLSRRITVSTKPRSENSCGDNSPADFSVPDLFWAPGDAKLLHQDGGVQLGPTARVLPEQFFRGSAVGDNKSVTFELYF